jgi:hypothetical protein
VRSSPAIADATGSARAGIVTLSLVLGMLLAGAAGAATSLASLDRVKLRPATARRTLVAAVVLSVGFVVLTANSTVSRAWNDFRRGDAVASPSAPVDPAARLTSLRGKRYEIWASAIRAFEAHPARGIGPGTFEFWWNRDQRIASFERDAHSLYLENLAELGLPGLLAILAFLTTLSIVALSGGRTLDPPGSGLVAATGGVFAVYALQAGVDWLWETTAVTTVVVLALVAAAARRSTSGTWTMSRRIPIALGAALCCLIQLPGLVSVSAVRKSQSLARAGDLVQAEGSASDAIGAQPWAATPYIQRALIREQQGKLEAARGDLLKAVRRERTNWRPWLLLARIDAERNAPAAAVRDFKRARALRPRSEFFGPSK